MLTSKVSKIMLLAIVGLASSFVDESKYSENADYNWVVENNSSISIAGSSNVNSFICEVKEYLHLDTLKSISEEKIQRLLFKSSQLNLDVRKFDCHNKFITQDFYKTMRVEDYPQLVIKFIAIEQFCGYVPHQNLKGWVDIQLASVTKRMQLDLVMFRQGGAKYKLTGNKRMKFSDFKLTAPSKVAGLIKINEEIDVEFELFFKAVG